jgi:hypothetical protein
MAGCGGHDASDLLDRAQDGLARIRTGTVDIHVNVQTPIPIERTFSLRAGGAQLSRIELTRWAKNPRRLACGEELECARAGVDVKAALRALRPLLPSLPIDPGSIRSAEVDVAVRRSNGLPSQLLLRGEVEPGGLVPGSVPFEVELDLPSGVAT